MNLNAKYYDQPEGSDLSGKMIATNKIALASGLAWSMYDVVLYSKPQGYLPTIARIAKVTGPFVGVASAFTLGTYAMTNLRNKDDTLNYIVGAYCAGSIWGACMRSVGTGVVMGSFFALAGVLKKLSIKEGWEFFPEPKGRGYSSLHGHDLTLMRAPPKNWTTGKEE